MALTAYLRHARPWFGRPWRIPKLQHVQHPRQPERTHAATAIHSGSKQSCNPSAVNEPSACQIPARASVTGVATHAIVASSESALGIARQWQHNFKISVPIAPRRRIAGPRVCAPALLLYHDS